MPDGRKVVFSLVLGFQRIQNHMDLLRILIVCLESEQDQCTFINSSITAFKLLSSGMKLTFPCT